MRKKRRSTLLLTMIAGLFILIQWRCGNKDSGPSPTSPDTSSRFVPDDWSGTADYENNSVDIERP